MKRNTSPKVKYFDLYPCACWFLFPFASMWIMIWIRINLLQHTYVRGFFQLHLLVVLNSNYSWYLFWYVLLYRILLLYIMSNAFFFRWRKWSGSTRKNCRRNDTSLTWAHWWVTRVTALNTVCTCISKRLWKLYFKIIV